MNPSRVFLELFLLIQVILNNLLVADIAAGVVFVVDILSSMENPGNTFVMLCGCLYLFQTLLQLIKPEKKEENISLRTEQYKYFEF